MKIRIDLVLAIAALAVTVAPQPAAAQGSKTSGPTLIKDTENSARSAVQGLCSATWTNFQGASGCDLMSVPTGKRVVVEHGSVLCYTEGTDFIAAAAIQTTLATTTGSYLVLVSQPGPSGANRWAASQSLRAYGESDSKVRGWGWFDGNPTDSFQSCQFSMTGHLVDVQ